MKPAAKIPARFINQPTCCDNAELFAQLPEESIDLILTDPPYKDYQSNRPVAHPRVKAVRTEDLDLDLFSTESYRVLKSGCHLYCFCDHLTFPDVRRSLIEAGFTYKNCLVWVKNNHGSGDLRGNWAPQHEFIIFAAKGTSRRLRGSRKSNVLLKRQDDGNIEFYKKVSNYKFNHGTAKPVDLLRSIIQSSSEPGDIVLDPYGGSGSTAEASLLERRRFILAEIDPEHHRQAAERLKNIQQSKLKSPNQYKRISP